MADQLCLDACAASFTQTIYKLNDVLLEALVQANGDPALEARAQDNFQRGMVLASRVKRICTESCNAEGI